MRHVKMTATTVVFIVGLIAAFLTGWLGRASAMEHRPVSDPKPELPLLTDAQVRTLGMMVGISVGRGVREGVRDALEKQTPWARPSA